METLEKHNVDTKSPVSEKDKSQAKTYDKSSKPEKIYDIGERTLEFSLRIIEIAEALPKSLIYEIIRKQVMRSGMSIGANVEEADGSVTKRDFINKASIARKEAKETKYWLKIINRKNKNLDIDDDIQEVKEIIKILSSMILNTKKSEKAK